MTHPIPEGENLRKAVKWLSEQRQAHPDVPDLSLVDKACLTFDLSPEDSEFLMRFVKESRKGG